MQSPLRRIILVLVLIGLLPVIFLGYELIELGNNQNIVRRAYQNQLDAILYSINQYSDDVISSWANMIRKERMDHSKAGFEERIPDFINQTNVVRSIYFTNLSDTSVAFRLYEEDPSSDIVKASLDHLIKKNIDKCTRLIEYAEAGFRKMQSIDTPVYGESIAILFALDADDPDFKIGVLVIDLPSVIKHNLAPKMQEISQGKLIISAFRTANDSLIYTTNPQQLNREVRASARKFKDMMQRKDLWILPGYYVGIEVIGASLEDLVSDRVVTVASILGVIALIFAAGFYFLYSNIKREIYLSQAKSEFVSNVSHEIRTPLSLIGMFAETLESNRVTTEEKKQEYYSIIAKETARLSRIVNRILNFSQLEANKKAFNFQPVQVNELAGDILKMYFYPMQEKGFTFEYNQDSKALPIRADKESVSETLINLIDNAIKYSRERKHITITTGVEGKFTFISVKDQGIGIARNHQRDIFDQFYRAPTGDVHNTKGSGLGLALVKKIVEAHGGEIKVESVPDKGSTFTVYFPYINNGQ